MDLADTLMPMSLLARLRRSHFLATLVLVWLALTLGVAVASPLLSDGNQVLLCSAGGMAKLVLGDDGSASTAPVALNCPLCSVCGAPAPAAASVPVPLPPLREMRPSIAVAHIAALGAAPPPARGPPLAA